MAPCLRCRMLRSSDTTADNGFREQGDLLQVPRRRLARGAGGDKLDHTRDTGEHGTVGYSGGRANGNICGPDLRREANLWWARHSRVAFSIFFFFAI